MICDKCGTDYKSYGDDNNDPGLCLACSSAYHPHKEYHAEGLSGVSGIDQEYRIYVEHYIYPPHYFEMINSGFNMDKVCTKCGTSYPRDGKRASICPKCRPVNYDRVADWRSTNPKYYKVYQKRNYEANKEARIAYAKAYRKAHPRVYDPTKRRESYLKLGK